MATDTATSDPNNPVGVVQLLLDRQVSARTVSISIRLRWASQ